MGKFHGRDEADHAHRHAHAHGEFVLQFRRRGYAEEPAALAGYVEGFVDGLLHVAAGFGQDFAHLAGHVARVFFFRSWTRRCLREAGFRRAWEREPGARCGRPVLAASTARLTSSAPEDGNSPTMSEWSAGFRLRHGFAAGGRKPLAADQIVIDGMGHRSLVRDKGQGPWRARKASPGAPE